MTDRSTTALPPNGVVLSDSNGQPPWLLARHTTGKQWSTQFADVSLSLMIEVDTGDNPVNAGDLDRALEYLGLSIERRVQFINAMQTHLA